MTSQDQFRIEGPNGVHSCLVLDLLGPSVMSLARSSVDGRLPGQSAISIAKQVLLGLSCLHDQNIGHGGKYLFLQMRMLICLIAVRSAYTQHRIHRS